MFEMLPHFSLPHEIHKLPLKTLMKDFYKHALVYRILYSFKSITPEHHFHDYSGHKMKDFDPKQDFPYQYMNRDTVNISG